MTTSRAVVLGAPSGHSAGWVHPLDLTGASQVDPSRSDELRRAVSGADCVLVDGGEAGAVEWLRAARRTDPAVQAVIVAEPTDRRSIERRVLLSPGLGEVWIVSPGDVGARLIERAAEVTRRRRRHSTTRARLAEEFATLQQGLPQRTVISDAYLAALLEAAPDPILSVDASGVVLSWNPACERVLGIRRVDAVGNPLSQIVPAAAAALDRVPPDAAAPVRTELRFEHADGYTGAGETIVIPVEVAGERIRAVILHDQTEQRRIRHELEVQADRLRKVNEALRQRTEELEQALGARSRFYAAMSHELRTPLNAILGYHSLLLEGLLGPLAESQAESLGRAQRATTHLVELVEDALDLARIEAGRLDLQVSEARLPDLVTELLDTLHPPLADHRSTITVEGPEAPHSIRTDPRRVRQILLNLMSNAIKFGEGQPVRVVWSVAGDGGVVIDIMDRGRGIDPDDLDRIFDEFVQIGSEEADGTGLGLAIARRLAEVLGGDLRVSSRPGEGSTFRLSLPPALPKGGLDSGPGE